jgi:hypothetical protein
MTRKLHIYTSAIFCVLIATLVFSGVVLGKERRTNWACNEQPFVPCNQTMENICNEQGNLCCQWTPPPSSPCVPAQEVQQCYSCDQYNCVEDLALSGQACLCQAGQQCCNKACYWPSDHSNGYNCAVNQFPSEEGANFQLCPWNFKACNGACYDSTIFTCCSSSAGGVLSPISVGCSV